METKRDKKFLVHQTTSLSNVGNLLTTTEKILATHNNFHFVCGTKFNNTHSNQILETCLSHNNKYLLTCGDDFTAKLWDALDGKLLYNLIDPDAKITKIYFSNNSSLLLTGNDHGTIRLWDIGGTLLKSYYNENEYIHLLYFTDDDLKILSYTSPCKNHGESYFKIWDFEGTCLNRTLFNSMRLISDNVIPALNLYLTGSRDTTRIVDYENRMQIGWINGIISDKNVFFSEDLEIILTKSEKKIYLWYKNALNLNEFAFEGLKIISSCISKTGEYILAATEDNKVRLLNNNGKILLSFTEHQSPPLFMSISNNSKFVLSSDIYETLLWNFNGRLISRYKNYSYPQGVQFSKDSTLLVIKCKKSLIIDLADKKQHDYSDFPKRICKIPQVGIINDKCYYEYNKDYSESIEIKSMDGNKVIQYNLDFVVSYAIFSKSGKYLLTFNKNSKNSFTLWDLDNSLINAVDQLVTKNNIYIKDPFHSANLSQNGGDVLTYELKESNKLRSFKDDISIFGFCAAKFSEDEKYIISFTGAGNQINLWNFGGKLISRIEYPNSIFPNANTNLVTISPDGTMIVFGDSCWNIDGSEKFKFNLGEIKDILNPEAGLRSCFSPNSKLIFTCSDDLLCRLWSKDGQCIRLFKGHKNIIKATCFSSDGENIISASTDGVIIIWDLKGNILQTIEDHKENISTISFSQDDKNILAFGGGITIWERKENPITM